MPKRALLERRPWLLASLIAAAVYFVLKDRDFPGLYLYLVEGAALLLLAVYAFLRHPSPQAKLLAGLLAADGLGVVVIELDFFNGILLLFVGLALAINLFLQYRRAELESSQKAAFLALMFLTPLIAFLLASGPQRWTVTSFCFFLGATAACGWASAYPRYRVGAGCVLYVASALLSLAAAGPMADSPLPGLLMWPLFYLGHFFICTGVIQTLRGELR